MASSSGPYHAGEIAVQQRAGERVRAVLSGRAVADHLRPGAVPFIENQSRLILGTLDPGANPWTSMLLGPPGFVRALDPRTLFIDTAVGRASVDDPQLRNVGDGHEVGLLFLEPATRRRLRVNGTVQAASGGWRVRVRQAYPNCPRFVSSAKHESTRGDQVVAATSRGVALSSSQRRLLTSTDTLFVSSAHPDHGVDVSHRGGPPGFVQIGANGILRIPDYAGNGMFNTLGNFVLNPRAGLACIDPRRHCLLQLTGTVTLHWPSPEESQAPGTGRFWELTPTRWIESSLP